MLNADIINAIEAVAKPQYQAGWDNSGLQVGSADDECTGVLLCVDCTPAVVQEAIQRGCSLIVSHHPLIFKGLKTITGRTPAEVAVMKALRHGVSIYSAHTSVDSAPGGVSQTMAEMLGARVLDPIEAQDGYNETVGLGVHAVFDQPLTQAELVQRIKDTFGSPVVRTSACYNADAKVERLSMCGGSGGEFIPAARKAGAQAYLTSDTRYHDFVDHGNDILLLDIGHYESEACTKQIFYRIITEKFTNFAVYISELESNPIKYQ